MSVVSTQKRERALAVLRDYYGSLDARVATYITNVNRAGMARSIVVLVAAERGEIVNLSLTTARAPGLRYHEGDNAVRVSGAGMDMAEDLASKISKAVHGRRDVLRHDHL